MNKWQLFIEKLKTPKGKKTLIIISIILVILIILSITLYNRYYKTNNNNETDNSTSIEIKKDDNKQKTTISELDGIEYPQDVANRNPIAIMVENHPDARPQAGLDKASIVYEAEAEGGITRFMAIFGPQDASKVGPVRSARTYYIDWALEYNAFYAHVGGSADGLALINQVAIKDINQFNYGTQAFWRETANNVATEHTMFTDTEKLRDIAISNDWETSTSDFKTLKFKDEIDNSLRPESQQISISFSGPLYDIIWNYNKENNEYLRTMGGSAHNDRVNGEQLKAKNIIVQEVSRQLITNSGGKQVWQMDTVGEGNAKIYQDGTKIDATWKKDSREERTIFYNLNNEEIKFNPGTTWYEIVEPGSVVTES